VDVDDRSGLLGTNQRLWWKCHNWWCGSTNTNPKNLSI